MADYLSSLFFLVALWAALGIALQWSAKETGLVTLSLGSCFGTGAYSFVLLTQSLSFSPGAAIALASCIAAVVGALQYGILSKASADEFVIGTFAFQLVSLDCFENLDSITGGPLGISGIAPFHFQFNSQNVPHLVTLLAWVFVGGISALSLFLYRRPPRRRLNALRDDKILAISLGISPVRQIICIGAVTGFIAGAFGALYSQFVSYIEPSEFTDAISLDAIVVVLLGSGRTPLSPILGAIFFVAIPELLRLVPISTSASANLRQGIYSIILLVLVLRRAAAGRESFVGGKDVSL